MVTSERSTHYQRYTLDFYLLATLTARLAGDDAAAHRFEEAATRLAEFTRTIADTHGRLPLIGDDDGGQLWPIAGRACDDVRDSLAVAATVLNRPDVGRVGNPGRGRLDRRAARRAIRHVSRRAGALLPAARDRLLRRHEDSTKATPCSTLVRTAIATAGTHTPTRCR